MTNSIKLNIVLPIYNEGNNLDLLLLDIIDSSKGYNIDPTVIAVNDGSRDDTKAIINKYIHQLKITYCEHEFNEGYARSLDTGIKAANDIGLLLVMDADNQFKYESVMQLLNHIDDFDIVVGQREKRNDNWLRIYLGKTWSIVGRYIFQTKINDLNCGFKLFRTTLIKKISINSVGPGVNLEIFSDPIIKSSKIKAIRVAHYPREYGNQSGASIKTILLSLKDLMIIFRKRFFKS
jgi:glycosyltransferase involved in cell wall biosynthesis